MQIEGIQRSQHNAVLVNEQQLNDTQLQPHINTISKLRKSTPQCRNGGNESGRYSPLTSLMTVRVATLHHVTGTKEIRLETSSTRNNIMFPPTRGHFCHHRGPFTRWIVESTIPRALEKPSKLEVYDGTRDPDEDIEHIDIVLDYYSAIGAVKCKLFVFSLKGSTMTWYKNLP
ncbi:hypothetical protein P8452_26098 [Trifolium repens]|nr:hypothetical protein P8452_26098 [Trifolium repens]